MLLWEGRVVSWQGGDHNKDDNFGFVDGDHHTNDDNNYDNDDDNDDNHAYDQAAQLRAARTD